MVSNLPADRDKWLFEPKLDGYRVIAVKFGGRADLYSMDGKLYNGEFPKILEALQNLSHKDVVLDGEIVAVEPSGRPNFDALQNRRSTKLPIYYIAFDCLHFEERDLLDRRLRKGRRFLPKSPTNSLNHSSRYSSSVRKWILTQQLQSFVRPKSKAWLRSD